MSTRTFLLPDVGEGLTEAEVVRWLVAEGDVVAVNAPVVEVETAKSVVELPTPWAGRVEALLVPEGHTVDVGTALIAVGVDEAAVGDAGAPDGAAGTSAPPGPGTAPADVDAEEGDVAGGLAGDGGASSHPGDAVGDLGAEQAPADAAADPATAAEPGSEAEAAPASQPEGGVSGAVLVGYGVREVVARRRRGRRPAPAVEQPAAGTGTGATAVAPAPSRPLATPPVRLLARLRGVDLAEVEATGEGGVVVREDVLRHHAHAARAVAGGATAGPGQRPPSAPELPGTYDADARERRVPIRGVRRATAQAMVASAFTAPHTSAHVTVDATRTVKLLDRLRADRSFEGVHVSPLLVIARAMCLAVARHPEINSSWDEAAREIVVKDYVNLGVAVASDRGLLVPNVKDAQAMDLRALAQALTALVKTARAGRTTPADMARGTISITNIGVFGVDGGVPILNPGESAILCMGAMTQRPWVHKGKIRPRWVVELALSFDHRVVDGDLGSRFLADVGALLERPDRALLWA